MALKKSTTAWPAWHEQQPKIAPIKLYYLYYDYGILEPVSEVVAKMTEKIKKPEHYNSGKKTHALFIGLACLVGLVLITSLFAGGAWFFYRDKALPNVTFANMHMGGKTREQVKALVEQKLQEATLNFSYNGEEKLVAPSDIGITFDVNKTVDAVMSTGRGNFKDLLKLTQKQKVNLAYSSDVGAAIAFAKQHYPNAVADAKDAQLTFADNTFTIQPGVDGKGFDIPTFTLALQQLAEDPKPITVLVTTTMVAPAIQADNLTKLQEEVNRRVNLSIKFLYQGRLMYIADPGDIANWVNFTPDPANKTATATYDKAKIELFLKQKVGPSIASPAQDRKVLRNPDTGQEIVIQAGREGRQLANIESLTNEILEALTNGNSYEKEVAITTAPFKTITLSGGTDHWVEVDLSEQRTSLWAGSTAVASFTISSGVAQWPTVTGEFAIWYKTPNQVMTGGSRASGDYYYLPNVTWVSYFYRDYGFHTAYWHNNFGQPMSHGCINMRQADAKALYDFAPIGTKVIVHA
ncbi:MAG TPA: L,D-transpeptidase family protein [Candidatus Saccharimonadales bacterium]|nr:L,D-transpeptidase family protein [Candidatus Saccharimonadales bacterium]